MAIDWTFSHRPSSFDDMALYPDQRRRLEFYAGSGQFSHLLFAGSPGTGKTTAARILGEVADHTIVEHNCAEDSSKETLLRIATTTAGVLFNRQKRCYIMDEFHEVPEPNQRMLNKIMEDRSELNVFIFCVNVRDRVADPIYSRCTTINFDLGVIKPKTNKMVFHKWVDMKKIEWVEELQRIARQVAKDHGYENIENHLIDVAEDDRYLVDARKYIREVEERIKMNEWERKT